MPLIKVLDKNGRPVKKDGKIKYRVKINFVDDNGNYKAVERIAYGSDEAKEIERKLVFEQKNLTQTNKLTVLALYDEYIISKRHEVRESSLEKSKQVLTNHVLDSLGKIKIDKLNTAKLQKWKQNIEVKNLSITMRKNIYGEFRALLNFAVKMEYISQNPLLKVGNFKAPLETHKEMLFYTPEEFKKYIKASKIEAEQKNTLRAWSYYVFFNIAFYMGMRKGEIYALTWNDIKDDIVHITKSLNQTLKGDDRITPPKNRSSIRQIQVPIPLKLILNEHFERCRTMPGFNNNYYICGGIFPLRDTSVDVANQHFAEVSKVKHIRLHDFRHSHASLLANNGINIQEIARRLGHSDIKTTLQTYSHLYPKESERALNVLNEIK